MGNHIICHHCVSRSVTPQESRKIRILLVGLDNAGKTTAAKGLAGEPVSAPAPTLGFSRLEVRRRGWTVELYDVGGGRAIRGIWHNYLAESHGLAFVVDASDAARADECRAALHGLLRDSRVRGKPVLILANKQDVQSALDEVELNERLQLEAAANEHRCPMRIELCSARLGAAGTGKKRHLAVQTGFNWLTDYVIENSAALEERVAADLAVRAAELEQQRRAREERVRRNREAAAAAAAAVAAAAAEEDAPAEETAAEVAEPAALPEEAPPAERDSGGSRPTSPTGAVSPPVGAEPAPAVASPPCPDTPLQPELEAQIQEVFTRTEMGRLVREREAADLQAAADGDGGGEVDGDESTVGEGGRVDGAETADGEGGAGGGAGGGEPAETCPVVLQRPTATSGRLSARESSPDSPVLEKDSGQGSIKESDSEGLMSSNASQLSAQTNGIDRPKRRNRFFKRYTKTAPLPDDVLLSLPSTPPTRNE